MYLQDSCTVLWIVTGTSPSERKGIHVLDYSTFHAVILVQNRNQNYESSPAYEIVYTVCSCSISGMSCELLNQSDSVPDELTSPFSPSLSLVGDIRNGRASVAMFV